MQISDRAFPGAAEEDADAPLVSVIVGAYNAVPFIARAINSVLTQSPMALEVVVVDDGSTDGTASFVKGQFGSDARVRVSALPHNGGPARARNVALQQARGKWIAVLDADDAFEPHHLPSLISLAEKHQADIAAGNFINFDATNGTKLGAGLHADANVVRLDKYAFVGGARPYTGEADFGLLKPIFNASFLRSTGLLYPEDVRHGEDMELVYNALLKGATYVLKRDLCSYLYTTRASGQSRTTINYRAQIQRTMRLACRPEVKKDSRLRGMLAERAHALRRLELDHRSSLARKDTTWLISRALQTSAGRQWLWSRAVKKLGR